MSAADDCQRVLDALFGTDRDYGEVIYHGGNTHSPGFMRRANRATKPMYTNQCTFMWPDGVEQTREDSNVAWCYVVTLDDVVEKVPAPDLEPTVIVETSEGSFQYQYALAEPVTLDEAKEFFERLKARAPALGDLGAMTANRLIKLPAGVNTKPGKNGFKTRLVSVSDTLYHIEDLISEWALPEVDMTVRRPPAVVGDFSGVTDEVVDWLISEGKLHDQNEPFHTIECPWGDLHTDGVTTAGYSPIGVGEMPNVRGFYCFHEHCLDKKSGDFLEWVESQGGPVVRSFDPVAPLVQRYVLLEYSQEVADTWAPADAPYPIVSLAAFRAAHREFISGERGGKQYHGELWLEHPQTVRCKGRVYNPGEPTVVHVRDVPHFNTYRPMSHERGVGDPRVYLEHIDWLIPNEEERRWFHQWIASKIQDPASRSYAMVLVADLAEGESGHRYGTGRSMVGDILAAVFQSGVANIELSDLTGQGDSQSAYNDWADSTQLVVIEETKSDVTDYRADHASYERLKPMIEPKPRRGVRVKPKYGKIYTTTLYCNFLFFTNHSDALQLPPDTDADDERRFCVLDCNKGRRDVADYAALYGFLQDPECIAALYWWYMDLSMEGFDRIYPMKTPAKQLMQRQSLSTTDEVWAAALERLPGDIVTKAQLRDTCANMPDVDQRMESAVMGMVTARWKKMADIESGWRLLYEGKMLTCRILRNHDQVRSHYRNGNLDALREMISQNNR